MARYKKTTDAEKRTYMRVYFQNRRQWYEDYKKTLSCNRCGFSHPAAIQFHHKDGDDKKMAISKMVHLESDINLIMQEIAKCEVLCANCHFVHHYKEGKKGGRPIGVKLKAKVKGVTFHVI